MSKAEGNPLHERYQLKESPSADDRQRARFNVLDSDGTAIFSRSLLTGGTRLTMGVAREMGKPVIHVEKGRNSAAKDLARIVAVHGIRRLNVAGPRASGDSQIWLRATGTD